MIKIKMRKGVQRSSPMRRTDTIEESLLGLSSDIVEEILLRVPVKSLMRFRCVSKQWRSLFMDFSFITKHLNRSNDKNATHMLVEHYNDLHIAEIESCTQMMKAQLLFKEWPSARVHVVASCDGLLCLSFETSDFQEVCLCNPVTREWQVLPEDCCSDSCYSYFGLGFDPKIKEYKVVKVTLMDDYNASVKIYTLGSSIWRRIHCSLPQLFPYEIHMASVTVSGAVHWVAVSKVGDFCGLKSLLSFDVQRELFEEVPLPVFGIRKTNSLSIGVLGGCLTVSTRFVTFPVEIWVMKEYGVTESWTHLFSISSMESMGLYGYRHILPLRFWKDGEILLQKGGDLILYDPMRKTQIKLGFCSLPCFLDYSEYYFQYYSFVESLVCPRFGRGAPSKS